MSSQDVAASVCLEEVLDSIGAELDNVTRTVGISDEVGLDTQVLIAICRIRPKDINHKLLFRGRNFVNNFKRSLNLFNLVETQQCAANASVQAHNSVVDDSSQGEPIKQVVDFVEN